jgi:predicted metal-dependent hydrolase
MARTDTLRTATPERIYLGGREIEYRLVRSKAAKKLRVKVALDGIQVVLPASRQVEDARAFLLDNEAWIVEQVVRMDRYRTVRKPEVAAVGEILFRGEPIIVQVIQAEGRRGASQVRFEAGGISVLRSPSSRTPPTITLENWLRKKAKQEIAYLVAEIAPRVNRLPTAVYVMGQRTKWGNCSALGNLSFNWRLVLAPDYVLRYLVTHEVVHLAIPDHSQRFWLTVQSLCPSSERARRWLSANGNRLMVELAVALKREGENDEES